MIEHLFMLRCIVHPQQRMLTVWRWHTLHDVNTHWLSGYFHRIVQKQLPSEAASLKDTPDVIQCDQCKGIFPSEFIHIKSVFEGTRYVTRIDLCEACYRGIHSC